MEALNISDVKMHGKMSGLKNAGLEIIRPIIRLVTSGKSYGA